MSDDKLVAASTELSEGGKGTPFERLRIGEYAAMAFQPPDMPRLPNNGGTSPEVSRDKLRRMRPIPAKSSDKVRPRLGRPWAG